MANPPSFSPRRKWAFVFQVVLLLFLTLAVVAMLNYLSRDYFFRFHLSSATRNPLSSRTLSLLQNVTNQVKVIIYYDKQGEDLYSSVADLLHEYSLANPKIAVQTVDYLRDAGAALQLKEKYPFLASTAAKNLVIFECNGRVKPVEGSALAQYVLEQVPNEKEREFRRRPTAFLGETLFSAAILDVTSPRRLKACFLQGHGEHPPDSSDENSGYIKFATILQQNFFQLEKLSLLGTNTIPLDCNLLVIAGPTTSIPPLELDKVSQYLTQGGRLMVLFNFLSASKATGLESILQDWGIRVGDSVVKDPENTLTGSDVIVGQFGKHPIVNPLLQSRLHMIMPRPVQKVEIRNKRAGAPTVAEIAFSGPKAFLSGATGTEPAAFPLIATVENAPIRGVITERGSTRILVAGDSIFLANRQIDSAANRDFASQSANWLLDLTELLQGLGPKPITEYRLMMTDSQLRASQWILLGAMPGAVLLLGAFVWVRRRK